LQTPRESRIVPEQTSRLTWGSYMARRATTSLFARLTLVFSLAACGRYEAERADAYARDEGASTPWLALEDAPADEPLADAGVDAGLNIPCEVARILESRCRICHDASTLAPPPAFALLAEFQQPSALDPARSMGEVAYERVSSLGQRRMPPASGQSLGEDELETLRSWLSTGALAGAPCPARSDDVLPPAEPEP
jgi:hypothetical protein